MNIYLVGGGGLLKIGKANNVKQRMATLQTASPNTLRLLGQFPSRDAEKVEKLLHMVLADFRVRGEWFEDCDVVRQKWYAAAKSTITKEIDRLENRKRLACEEYEKAKVELEESISDLEQARCQLDSAYWVCVEPSNPQAQPEP